MHVCVCVCVCVVMCVYVVIFKNWCWAKFISLFCLVMCIYTLCMRHYFHTLFVCIYKAKGVCNLQKLMLGQLYQPVLLSYVYPLCMRHYLQTFFVCICKAKGVWWVCLCVCDCVCMCVCMYVCEFACSRIQMCVCDGCKKNYPIVCMYLQCTGHDYKIVSVSENRQCVWDVYLYT